jgi:hypothetical protein
MTKEEAKRAIENNSTVFYVKKKDHKNRRWIIDSFEARSFSDSTLYCPEQYHFSPKDAVIDHCMRDVEILTSKIEKSKESVGWEIVK